VKIDAHKKFGKRECPACACEVSANSNRCPICGYPFPNPTPARRMFKIIAALVMLGLFLLLILR